MIPVLYWSNYSSLTQGGQKSLYYVLQDLDRSKYSPVLACREQGSLTAKARELGIPVELMNLPAALRPWYVIDILKFILSLFKIIDKHGIRIIHSEELRVVFMAFFIKPFRYLQTIWHVRVYWDNPFQKKVGLLISDAVICVSRSVGKSFKSDSNKIHVICNGIDPEEFKPGGEKASSVLFSENDILIGQIGTLVENKKTHVFIKAAAIVLKTNPSVKFLIIGKGDEEYTLQLKNLAEELKVSQNVIFWGEEDNIKPLLNRLTILSLISQNEGLSRTLLEAMALEKAIVASDIPQNRELIIHNKTGLTAKLNSPEDTARQLNLLLADKSLALRLGKAAREYVVPNFTLKMTISLIHKLYETLITGKEIKYEDPY